MPEVSYTTTLRIPHDQVWGFVKDMNNWAPFLTGYQAHEILSETDSLWTLKGDVGILSRTVKLKARVTEWSGPDKVTFTLEGLNEDVEGGGVVTMGPYHASTVPLAPPLTIASWFRRLIAALFRKRSTKAGGTLQREATRPPQSQLTFTLRMEAGGPTGPIVNALLGPALLPATEQLANKIAAHLHAIELRP